MIDNKEIYEYNNLSKETQIYLNKAMDIYDDIKDKLIEEEVQHLTFSGNYRFTEDDKLVLSLFLAGFLVEGRLQKNLEKYDIDPRILLLFAHVDDTKIKPLIIDYETYYEAYNLKSDIISLINEKYPEYDINGITPELIFNSLGMISPKNSNILNYFGAKYKISGTWFKDHPLFNLFENLLISENIISTKQIEKFNKFKSLLSRLNPLNFLGFRFSKNNKPNDDNLLTTEEKNNKVEDDNKSKDDNKTENDNSSDVENSEIRNFLDFLGLGGVIPSTGGSVIVELGPSGLGMISHSFGVEDEQSEKESEQPAKESESKKLKDKIEIDDEVWSLLDEVQEKFIGQENVVEDLFYNIINNQQLGYMEDLEDGQRSIIFLDGPTGTGKTAIVREITDQLDIPFTRTTITNYSSTGYVGGDLTDNLKKLYKQAGGDLERAQRGTIVFDEFDKISYSKKGGLSMKKAVQEQLLDFMGGGKYTVNMGGSGFFENSVEFDTSKLTFICLGALTDLRDKKTKNNKSIGFKIETEGKRDLTYTITSKDLEKNGFERELAARFNTFLHTDDYSKEDLLKILKESTISPLLGFKRWIEYSGKKLVMDDDVYDVIASEAYKLNIGARSLQTIMNNVRTKYIKKVLRGKEDTIYLDAETVKKAINDATLRKVRK